jgi:protein-S-isoprenylcysteine O-methyltransferase Ste14
VLEEFVPIGALDALLATIPKAVGLLAAAGGFGLDLAAMSALARHGTAILPNAGTSALVREGAFAWTRNPIYLGNTIMLLGFAAALRWGWLAIAAPLTMIAVTRLAIMREERHLELRFGDDWRAYATRVRRWL